MPSAAPVPRGPTILTLYAAADLLTGPGCPVCRYADEAAARYLAWFALEGHADAVAVTRLCSSLGMCPRHTRALIHQPGAARRLTAVYRYVMETARGALSGPAMRPGVCPACEHDDGATVRALDTLLEGLAQGPVRERCRELGGLCIPHLHAASARGSRQVVTWLSGTLKASAGTWPTWLAGSDRDADMRAALRRRTTATSCPPTADACAACLAAGWAEDDRLTHIACGDGHCRPDRRLLLCPGHLSDLVGAAAQGDQASLLAWQANCLTAAPVRRHTPPVIRGRVAADGGRWFRRRRTGDGPDGCPVCLVGREAERRAVDQVRVSLRDASPGPRRRVPLCVRHLLSLKAADPRAWDRAELSALERADGLIAELDEAFGKGTWARRHEARGPEMTEWRRAVVFLDGGVFRGCPPGET